MSIAVCRPPICESPRKRSPALIRPPRCHSSASPGARPPGDTADPARGSFNTFDIDLASTAIGSVASFVRATYQNSTYTHLGSRLVFARSTRIGIEEPSAGSTGSLEPLLATNSSDIPLPERFFAGGGTTLRGFGSDPGRSPRSGDRFPGGGARHAHIQSATAISDAPSAHR